ncbi:MAG: asparagine synthetase B, partial [Alphaproteobacteria bacterium]
MCGIVGVFDTRGRRPIEPGLLERMNESQVHRGPDAGGVHLAPGIGLGHRRLSIIDLSGGAQPLYNEDRGVVTVYNGEIYNFRELAKELAGLGHRFRTHCDTEVVVHAWEEWGERCVERFRGMFAFAIWDDKRETLFLARDRLGIKPLHYALTGEGELIFASEIKALTCHPRLRRDIDPTAVEDYFAYGYVPDPKSIYRDVRKLAPGHTLTLRRGAAAPAPRQ